MPLHSSDSDLEIRAGTPADVPLLLRFIRAMAEFEKLSVSATEESLHAALFGDEPAARTLLAFKGGKPAGYATWFFSFSSMMARRALWLDDLFVDPAFRGTGIGKALMVHLAGIAARNRCARFEWIVLDWNESAIEFYRRIGADILADWRICRLDEAGLKRLGGKKPGLPGNGC